MLIINDRGTTRNIDERKFYQYKAKGYKKVEEKIETKPEAKKNEIKK